MGSYNKQTDSFDHARDAKKHQSGRHHHKHHRRPCGVLPRTPHNTTITYEKIERARHMRIRAIVTWDEVTLDTSGHNADIDHYVVHLQRSDDGITWDTKVRRRIIKAKDNDADTTAYAMFHHVVKRYYYRAQVRSVDKNHCKSAFAGDASGTNDTWTDASLPLDDDAPPRPKNVQIYDKGVNRIVLNWDAPTVNIPTHGTVDKSSGTATVTGTNTKFTTEVGTGTEIKVGTETRQVTVVTDDTHLTVANNWSNNGTAVNLYTVHPDPDVAHYEVQISHNNRNYNLIYKKDDFVHQTKKAIKIEDGDEGDTFYGRVRSIDASHNKSAHVEGTITDKDSDGFPGNSDPAVAGDGVTVGKGGKTKHTWSVLGRLRTLAETETHDLDIDEALTLFKIRMRVKQAPTGANLIVKFWKNNSTLAATMTITDGTKRTVNDSLSVAFADGDSASLSIEQVGSTTPGKHLTLLAVFT